MATLRDRIIEVLISSEHITHAQLNDALELQKKRGVSLKRILIDEGIISEEALLSLLAEQLLIPSLQLSKYRFDRSLMISIPEQTARQYNLIPLSKIGDTITVAMSDPLDILALDDIKMLTGCNIDIVLCPEAQILKAIDLQYSTNLEVEAQQSLTDDPYKEYPFGKEDAQAGEDEEIELTSALQESEKAPILKLVDFMLNQALLKRASDIHVEPEIDHLRIRYRIDGALHDIFKVPKANQNAVLARLKIISNLDITENRIPQDGRFKVKFENREIDFRVSSLPTTFGQKFVLRVLDKSNLSIGLDKLGFNDNPLAAFKEAISKPFGMILVTGPTGSGKSTTLYSLLSQLNTLERNIITTEDPVEYQMDGITQIQVRSDIGLDFATCLRSLLRQSPDVIMVGEIRDAETADIAIKAALTGQMVLSTLHTNDAISSISRLIDMGVEPFLVASSLIMLCAQRLCRKLCTKCRKPAEYSPEFLKDIGYNDFLKQWTENGHEKITLYNAQGCKYCSNTGFYGRIAILEAVLINDTIREMIIKKESLEKIKQYAVEKCGFLTLRDDAFLKVAAQMTTLDEAIRITSEE